jgi:hypothetical protein
MIVALPWIICALACAACAALLFAADKRLASASRAIAAYRSALVVERARSRRRGGFDWRDSHLHTRVSDDQRLTSIRCGIRDGRRS